MLPYTYHDASTKEQESAPALSQLLQLMPRPCQVSHKVPIEACLLHIHKLSQRPCPPGWATWTNLVILYAQSVDTHAQQDDIDAHAAAHVDFIGIVRRDRQQCKKYKYSISAGLE